MSSEKVTLREVLAEQMAKDPTIVGAKVDGAIRDVHTPFVRAEGTKIEPIRSSDADGLRLVRHSAAHVMADAVQRLFPGTKVTFGPATASGFYYDFDKPGGPFTDEDLARIEDAMREIIKKGLPFRREGISRDAARELFASMGETYKREHVDHIPEGEEISLYRHGSTEGEWLDLCEGPHVPTTRHLGAVKLVSVAGAYWRGDERNPMLQRIYGTAFPTQKALDAHLKLLEEAKARDHRKLGKELELFMFHEYAPAMPFLLPRGATVYNGLISYMRGLYVGLGYEEVDHPADLRQAPLRDQRAPPQLPREHVPPGHGGVHRRGSEGDRRRRPPRRRRRPAPSRRRAELERLGLKPMNCPSHCLIFGHRRRSYRELPWRVADFGRLHRHERGGVVHGLARVRTFCQDDAHIFCTRGPGPRRDQHVHRPLLRRVQGVQIRQDRHQAGDPPREAHRRRRPVGRRGEGAHGSARRSWPRVRGVARRGRVLRPQVRVPRAGRPRPELAARHAPARLRPAREASASSTPAPTAPRTGR